MNKRQEDFVYFLEDTLIPDLVDSGMEFTAQDFEEGIIYLRSLTSGTRGYRTEAKKFIGWLRSTLIPDLKDSGRVSTAKDFSTLAKMIETELNRR